MSLSNEPPRRAVPLTKAQIQGLTNALHSSGAGPGHCAAFPAVLPLAGRRPQAQGLPTADVTKASAGHLTSSFTMSQPQGFVGEEPASAADVKQLKELCKTVNQNLFLHNNEDFHKNLGLLITGCQKLAPGLCRGEDEVTTLGEHLLTVMCEGTLPQDSHMLVSAAFCSVLLVAMGLAETARVLVDCLSITESRRKVRSELGQLNIELEVGHPDSFTLGVCHGVLQMRACSKVFEASLDVEKGESSLVSVVFYHLRKQCALYSRFTFTAFRLLVLWLQKVTEVSKLDADTCNVIFMIVNGNWENPLNGVRAQNSRLLQTLLNVCESGDYTLNGARPIPLTAAALLETTMWTLPWHVKSKYFILEVLLPKYGVMKALDKYASLVEGLCWSLSQVPLASAGTLVYRACLGGMTAEDWLRHFLQPVVALMSAPRSCVVSVQEQNLLTYWILPTVNKFPSLLPELVTGLTAIPHVVNRPSALFAVVSLLRIGQRVSAKLTSLDLGLVDVGHLVEAALEHSDPVIRNEGISLLCMSLGTVFMSDFRVFDMLSVFLVDNVSIDNSQLRKFIINSFIVFLLKVRDSCEQEMKNIPSLVDLKIKVRKTLEKRLSLQQGLSDCFPSIKDEGILTLTVYFFHWLHYFIILNLEAGSNYQRKIISLQLLKSVLLYIIRSDCMSQESGMFHQKKCNNNNVRLPTLLGKTTLFNSDEMRVSLLRCILDRTEDVREEAAGILMQFFSLSGKDDGEEKSLLRTAMHLCKCWKFYTAESGALLIQVVAAWLDAERSGRAEELVSYFLAQDYSAWCKLRKCEDSIEEDMSDCSESEEVPRTIPGLLLMCAELQADCLRRDLARSAMCGAPLHGLLAALTRLVQQPYGTFGPEEVDRLLALVEATVTLMLAALSGKSAAVTGVSPSFAEMMEAIEDQISNMVEDEDSLHISAAHQTVLSCVWLNLKACCEVASALVGLGSEPGVTERCGRVIVHVLAGCRHKGAIEAAGRALVSLVSQVTSRGAAAGEAILEQFLGHLQGGAASVTRRSAGLAILVHKLAAGDQLPGKRLLQRAVLELLKVARGPVDAAAPEHLDCPQGRALHLLRPLMQDAALWRHVAPHVPDLAGLCLSRLACPRWPVRNAALLLFGALVSKIVGKEGGTVEEFLYHYPGIAESLLQQLKTAGSSRECPSSRIVPTLSLLCRLSFTTESFADSSLSTRVAEFQLCFRRLLSNKDHVVRKLSAKAYAHFVPHSEVSFAIENVLSLFDKLRDGATCKKFGQNELNGILMLVKYLTERFRDGNIRMPQKKSLTLDLNVIWNLDYIADYNRVLVLEICREVEENLLSTSEKADFRVEVLDLQTVIVDPFCIVKEKMEVLHLLNCSADKLPAFCSEKLWDDPSSRPCLAALKLRLEKDGRLTRDCKTRILCSLLSAISRASKQTTAPNTPQLLETAFMVLRGGDVNHLPLSQSKSFTHLMTRLSENEVEFLMNGCHVAVAVMARLVLTKLAVGKCRTNATRLLSRILQLVGEHTRAELKHEDCRLHAAVAMHILTPSLKLVFASSNTPLGIEFLKLALTMLQDESSAVRNEAAAFVVKLKPRCFGTSVANPYHCIRKLLSVSCLEELLSFEEALKFFWRMFLCSEDLECVSRILDSESQSSPYDHGDSNMYREECKTLELMFSSVLNILKANTSAPSIQQFTCIVMSEQSTLGRHISNVCNLLGVCGDDRSKILECYSKLHLILNKLNYKLLIMKQLEKLHGQKLNKETKLYRGHLDSARRSLADLVMPLQLSSTRR